jgi:hypothetical protein
LHKVNAGTTYECASCRTLLPDTNATRIEANARGTFIATAASVNAGHIGLHWNALATMSWGELGVLMLKAKESVDQYGDDNARMQFKQKRLAMPWSEEGGEMVSTAESANYKMGDAWDAEAMISPKGRVIEQTDAPQGSIAFRTMGVDVQGHGTHFWVVVRRWAKSGHSRLMAFARIESWADVEAFAKQHAVHPAMVFVDSGDASTVVYRECAKRNWKSARGSGNEDFAVTDRDGNTTRRYYSEKQAIVVPGIPQRAILVSHSNLGGKDLLHGLRARRVWGYALDASPEYVEQVNAEVRVKDRRTGKPMWILPQGKRDNHAFDCEILNLLAAVRWGIAGRETTETDLPQSGT